MKNENKNYLISDVEADELMLEEKKPSTSEVLYEDTSRRGKNTKHFRLRNGNFMAVTYDHPIHKLDPDTGKYVDVTSEVNETETDYETLTDRFKVRMPKAVGKKRFVTLEKDGREISFRLVPKGASHRKNAVALFTQRPMPDPWEIGNRPSFTYAKADTYIDLQYDVSDDGVKESIILSKDPGYKIFSFELKLKGLTPALSEDGKTVSLLREGETPDTETPEMKIPPAFMQDANDAFCDDIHYELRTENGVTFLDLVLDTDWLSDPERAFPVVIDPRVEISRFSGNNLKMAEVCSNGSTVSAENATAYRRVGIDDNGYVHRLYISMDLPTLAEGFKITKAGLLLHQKDYVSYDGMEQYYEIRPVSDPNGSVLSVDSFSWANVQQLNMGNIIDTLRGYYRRRDAEIDIDLTKTVEDWYDTNKTFSKEKCLVIKKVDETVSSCDECYLSSCLEFYSLYADYKNRPKMYIEYTSTDMYSDHQKFHTFEVGRAGTGSINLFTGKMSFAHGDVTAEGVKLPLSISHLYRHEYVTEGNSSVTKYGHGWKLSVEQTLDIINKHGIMAVYTNAQGKRHYFTYNQTNANGEITDDAGLGLTYKEECNCICDHETTHLLVDEKGNKMTFNSEGKLTQLIDTYGNVSCLNYTNGKLTGVIDGGHHSAELYYHANGQLDRIVENEDSNRVITYSYNSAGELVTVTYPSDEPESVEPNTLQTQFMYDVNHRLIQVIDYSGISYSISYDNMGRVLGLSSFGNQIVSDGSVISTEAIADNSISFEYRSGSTAIVDDRTKIRTVYKFDANGRELSSYQDYTKIEDEDFEINESTPTEISGYASIVDSLETYKVGKYRSLSVSLNKDAEDEENLISNGCFTAVNTAGQPSEWSVIGSGSVDQTSCIPGKRSYCFTPTSGYSKLLSQSVDLCNCQLSGNVLVVSAWAKASENANANSESSSAKFRLCLKVAYEGGEEEEYFENYETGYNDWQYAAIPFVLHEECCPISVTVTLDYTANTGTCRFTNVRLVATDGLSTTNSYKTDETPMSAITVFGESKEIKMITSKADSVQTTIEYIDDDSDIVRTTVVDREGNRFTTDYKYDSQHNLIKTEDYRGLVIEYTYNDYGKELTRKTYHKDTPDVYMYSEYTYQDDSFIKSESDPRYMRNGEKLKTAYQHDTERNLLLKQTAVNGQEYHYSYNETTDDLISLSSTTDNRTNENEFFYTRGYLTRVAHNGFDFRFAFDQLGRSKSVTVGDASESTSLLTMSYAQNGLKDIVETAYASGERNSATTDIFGNPTLSTYTDKNNVERIISNATYDSVGKVKQLVDNERGVCYNYTHDANGNVTSIVETDLDSEAVLATNTFVFDDDERLSSKTYSAVGQTYRPIYEKNASGHVYPDNEVLGIALDGKFTDKVIKDGLRRADRKTFLIGTQTLFDESYTYLTTPYNGKTIATEIVASVASHVYGTSANSSTLSYTYDKAGNLETVSRGTSLLSKYYYDGLSRLKREDNHTAGKTYVWDYDVGGNILYKKEYALCTDVNLGACLDTKTYTYKSVGWKDQLTSYNGESCTYDAMGNPIVYRGKTLTWTKVRRLAAFDGNTFAYGANGIRYRKNNTVYTLDGNKILRESDGTKTLTYYHGGSGIVGFAYNGTDYYFRKNLQGDVTEIYTSAGLKVASYVYDAWGKVLAVNNETADHIGDLNPIRYRSYYYDVETGLYYLCSRYYDPEVGRFINADTTDVLEDAKYDIGGLNLYVYCDNNPVAGRDDEGDKSFWKKLAIAAAVVVAVAVVAAVVTVATGGTATAALCAVGSTFLGAAKGAVVGAVTGAVGGAVTGAVTGAIEGYKEDGWDGVLSGMGKGALKGAVQGAQDGMLSGMVMGSIAGAMNPSFCFVAGTAVLTTLGKKAIETIKVGDSVPCVDHITGETAEKRVVSTTVNKVERLIELDIDGEIIQCTETHPFHVKNTGWVDACNLNPGDVVYTKDWNTATVNSVNLLELDEPVEVFNFEVEDCHTYFVGELGVLVHNACGSNHGNSLKTTKPAEGYILKEKGTDRVLKFGETTRGKYRYTKKYLENNNAVMDFVKKGTKAEMHSWQHNMISNFFDRRGVLPPLNKSFW